MNSAYDEFVILSNKIHEILRSRVKVVSTTPVPDGTLPHGVTATPIQTRHLTKEQMDSQDKWFNLSKDVSLFLKENNIF
jgi:hypothetical protein